MAPGVTSMATTRQAPTACSAATAVAASSASRVTCSSPRRRPSVRAWFGSKQKSIRSFHFKPSTSKVTALITMTCTMSGSEMPRMLPRMMTFRSTRAGNSEISSRPSAKKAVKTIADGRVLADPAFRLDEGHRPRGQQTGDEGAQRERQAEDVGHRHARHDRVRQGVAHQRPALERDEG